jgi:adenylate cyclase
MFKRNQTFRIRLLQIFVSLMMISGILVTVIFYMQTTKIVFGLSEKISSEVVGKVKERTNSFLAIPSSFTRLAEPLIRYDGLVEDHEKLWDFMWNPILMTEQLESYFIADRVGNYVQVRRTPVLETRLINRDVTPPEEFRIQRDEDFGIVESKKKIPTFDPRSRVWYKNTGIMERYYWTEAYVATTSQKPVIGCAYPVLTESGDKGAVVCVNIPVEKLSSFLQEQNISENSRLYIIDDKEQIIASQNFDEILVEETVVDEGGKSSTVKKIKKLDALDDVHVISAYLRYKSEGLREFNFKYGRQSYFFRVSDISEDIGVDWKIISVISERDILEGVYRVILMIALAIVCIFLLSIVVIFYISGRITAPLEALAGQNEKLQNFDLDISDKVSSSIVEINNMSVSLFNAVQGLKAFRKYVPADLVRQLIDNGEEVEVGGVPKKLTLFFTDIKGFTTISENLSSDFLMQHLSEYFDELSRIIMEEAGTIDKYIGDSIMAFWGAPVRLEDATARACYAALRCQKRLSELNEQWLSYNKPVMETRIGIGTGRVVVGNVGSSDRINYSAIGDHVNLASRIEGINKLYGTKIIIDEDTWREVKDQFYCRFLDIVAVKGKNEGTRIYELISETDNRPGEAREEYVQIYEKALALYLKRDWTNSLRYFLHLKKKFDPEDEAVKLFIKRCSFFRKYPDSVPADWNGVTKLTRK